VRQSLHFNSFLKVPPMTASPSPERDSAPSIHVPVLVLEVLQCLNL
jgi:hypothetical protein